MSDTNEPKHPTPEELERVARLLRRSSAPSGTLGAGLLGALVGAAIGAGATTQDSAPLQPRRTGNVLLGGIVGFFAGIALAGSSKEEKRPAIPAAPAPPPPPPEKPRHRLGLRLRLVRDDEPYVTECPPGNAAGALPFDWVNTDEKGE